MAVAVYPPAVHRVGMKGVRGWTLEAAQRAASDGRRRGNYRFRRPGSVLVASVPSVDRPDVIEWYEKFTVAGDELEIAGARAGCLDGNANPCGD